MDKVKPSDDVFYPAFQKMYEEIRQLKESLGAEKARAERLKLGLQHVIGKCKRAEAYTDAAYAHYYAYSALQEVYGDGQQEVGMDS